MDSLNLVALTGVLERPPIIRTDEGSSTARCSATLRCEEVAATGPTYNLYLPLEAWGKVAEALSTMPADTAVWVTGKLYWRKARTPDEKGQLAVLVGKVSVL